MPADLTREEIERLRRTWHKLDDDGSLGASYDQMAAMLNAYPRLLDMAERSLSEPARTPSARAEGVRELADRIRAILANDAECCGNPDMRDIYAYDEHGNATDIIGAEPDGCCGCPVQRDPSMILAEVNAAISPPPAEPSAPVAPDWPTRCAALEADGIAARRRVAELLAENAKLRAIVKELDDALGEDDGEYPDDKPMTLKCGRWTYYSLSLGLLRRARSLLQGGHDAAA